MAKTEALVNNTYKQKNRVMLNGDGNENGIKFNRSNWHKNEFARAAHFFFSIAKKQICTCSTLFCLSLPLFCTTTIMPSCTTKTSNFLVTHYFCGGIVVCAY